MGRTDAVARLAREELFDDPILERVERDDRDPPTRTEDAHRREESALDVRELVVDRNPECLEDTRRGVDVARALLLHAVHEATEVVRSEERLARAAAHDGGRDATGLGLLAVLGEDTSKVFFAPGIHEVGRCDAKVRVGTHVQRA